MTYDTEVDNSKNVAPVSAINTLFSKDGLDMDTTIVLFGMSEARTQRVFQPYAEQLEPPRDASSFIAWRPQ